MQCRRPVSVTISLLAADPEIASMVRPPGISDLSYVVEVAEWYKQSHPTVDLAYSLVCSSLTDISNEVEAVSRLLPKGSLVYVTDASPTATEFHEEMPRGTLLTNYLRSSGYHAIFMGDVSAKLAKVAAAPGQIRSYWHTVPGSEESKNESFVQVSREADWHMR
jgi:hypothetical protein